MEFVRWGGLSAVKQKERFVPDKILKSDHEIGTFHRPPTRRGIYAFLPDCIEMFLVAWKLFDKEKQDENGRNILKKEFEHPRRFSYSGKIWTHIHVNHPQVTYYRKRDSWYETDTDSLPIILKLHKWELNNEGSNDSFFGQAKDFPEISRVWRRFCKDHFEVFIERVN